MNEEVIISIKGLRVTEDTDEDVEVITPGKYYLKNGKHYLLYDEIDEESGMYVLMLTNWKLRRKLKLFIMLQ